MSSEVEDTLDNSRDTPKFPRLKSDTKRNNYAEWSAKAEKALDDMGLLEVITGPTPVEPELVKERIVEFTDAEGKLVKGKTKGNQEVIDRFKEENKGWIAKNKRALRWITNSVSGSTITLVRNCKTAREAWENLRTEFRPTNIILASNLRRKIISYVCDEGMNINDWIMNMRRLYDDLVDVDPNAMKDEDFGRTLLDLLPLTSSTWRNFLSGQREDLTKPGTRSRVIIEAIKTEYYINHKDHASCCHTTIS